MEGRSAIACALELRANPALVRRFLRSELPEDIEGLLKIAVGDQEAVVSAAKRWHSDQYTLQSAAGFFIEQILLNHVADSYRVLGCLPTASYEQLRRHMALIMRWLHPDLQLGRSRADAGREIFVARVTCAWNDVKTEERRNAYQDRLATQARTQRLNPRRRPSWQDWHGSTHPVSPAERRPTRARWVGWQPLFNWFRMR